VNSQLSKDEIEAIKSIRNLTPGGFKVVYEKHCLLERKTLNHSMLIETLRAEIEAKGKGLSRRIGF
jgi:hypothetical protein